MGVTDVRLHIGQVTAARNSVVSDNTIHIFLSLFRSSETTAYFWTTTVAVSLIPFIVWGYYLTTWDVASLQSHCKDIISRHLYKAEM